MKIIFLLLLISGVLIGCSHLQASSKTENLSQNTTLTNLNQSDLKTPPDALFKGNHMTVIEDRIGDMKRFDISQTRKSCLTGIDEKFREERPALDTEYFEFDAVQTHSSGPDRFTVKVGKDLFSKIDPKFLTELDQIVGFTMVRNLYLLKSGNRSYLLLIGPESASSGIGELYEDHLLIPLAAGKVSLEFQSISDDPGRVRLGDAGTIYYSQIDPPYFGAVKETGSKSLRLKASLFSVDSAGNKRLESKVDFDCSNPEEILANED